MVLGDTLLGLALTVALRPAHLLGFTYKHELWHTVAGWALLGLRKAFTKFGDVFGSTAKLHLKGTSWVSR